MTAKMENLQFKVADVRFETIEDKATVVKFAIATRVEKIITEEQALIISKQVLANGFTVYFNPEMEKEVNDVLVDEIKRLEGRVNELVQEVTEKDLKLKAAETKAP